MPDPRVATMRLNQDQINRIDELINHNISTLKQQAESVFETGDIQGSVKLANEADDLAEIRRRLIAAMFHGTN